MTPLPTGRPTLSLSLVLGVGELGERAIAMLREQLAVLPVAFREATRIHAVDASTLAAGPVEALRGARDELASAATTDRLHGLGFVLEGGDLQRRVTHYLAADLDDLELLVEVATTARAAGPTDAVTVLLSCDSADERALARHAEMLAELAAGATVYLLTATNAAGETVDARARLGSLVGALLVALVRPLPALAGTGARLGTLGFAGCYGLGGPVLERLASCVACQLLDDHLTPQPASETAPADVDAALEALAPRALALRLFDPATQPGRLGTRPGGRLGGDGERVPVAARWTPGGTLEVRLDRGAIGHELTPPAHQEQWVAAIRRWARTVDMTLGHRWRLLLDRAAAVLAVAVREDGVRRLSDLLARLVRSPHYARSVIERLRAAARERLEAAPEGDRDLDRALERLAVALVQRPSAVDLALRLLVLVPPALVAAAGILSALYSGTRLWLLGGAVLAAGLGLPVAWVVHRLLRAERRIERARRDALAVVTGRQEGIVAENAVAALRADVLPGLVAGLLEAEARLDAYYGALANARDAAEAALDAGDPGALTFFPVLSRRAEIERLRALVGLDRRSWLEDAIRAGQLLPDRLAAADAPPLAVWCRARLAAMAEAGELPAFDQLLALRDSTDQAVSPPSTTTGAVDLERLYRLATPLAPSGLAPAVGAENAIVLLPAGILAGPAAAPCSGLDPGVLRARCSTLEVVVDAALPLLACLRIGGLARPLRGQADGAPPRRASTKRAPRREGTGSASSRAKEKLP